MAKHADPVAKDGEKRLFVGSWKSEIFGQKPHVSLSIKSGQSDKSATGPTMKLTPSDARRLAIALLTEAEDVEQALKKP